VIGVSERASVKGAVTASSGTTHDAEGNREFELVLSDIGEGRISHRAFDVMDLAISRLPGCLTGDRLFLDAQSTSHYRTRSG